MTKALRDMIRAAMATAFAAGYEGEHNPTDRLMAEIQAGHPELDRRDCRKIRSVIDARHSFGKWDLEDAQTVARREREAQRAAEIAERVAQFEEALRSFDVLGPFVIESVITGDSVRIGG